MIRVGVDVGGTFTDIILERIADGERQVAVTKVPSTPRDQSEGVVRWNPESLRLGGRGA